MKTFRKVIIKLVYIVAMLFAIAGLVAMASAISGGGGDNVMQQTASIAFAIGLGVLPYCVARAVEKILS